MPRRYYSSTAVETTLTSNVSNSATTLPVASTSGFPAQTPYTLILDEGTVNEEIVTVTGVATLNLTVTRGSDGTSAVSHSNGATVKHGVSARDFDEPNDHINDSTNDVHTQYVRKSLVDAKGDLLTATADDTPARLGVGANDTLLVADSAAATGLKWAALAASQVPTLEATKVPTQVQNARTDSYTLVLADAGKLIEMGKATAQTLTIPTNASVAFPIGTKIDVVQTGAGETTIAGAGVTINSEGSKLKLNAQWAGATLIKRGTDTWVVIGSLKA